MTTPGTVLLHDNLNPHGQNLLFTQPREVLVAHDAEPARAALARLRAVLDAALRHGGRVEVVVE